MIHQIMNMQHITTGEDSFKTGLQHLIYYRSFRLRINLNPCLSGQLIFRDQPHSQQQCITGNLLLCSLYGCSFLIHLCQGHTGQPLFSMDFSHCMP